MQGERGIIMKCKYCYAELQENAEVCPVCGKLLIKEEEEVQVAQPVKKEWKLWQRIVAGRVRNKELTSSQQPGFCRGQQGLSQELFLRSLAPPRGGGEDGGLPLPGCSGAHVTAPFTVSSPALSFQSGSSSREPTWPNISNVCGLLRN